MERRDQHGRPVGVDPAPQLADRLLGAEQRLRGDGTEGEDDFRLDHGELVCQKRCARSQLIGLGGSVGPATFDKYMDTKLLLEEMLGRRVDLVTRKALKERIRPNVEREAILVT